MKRRSRPAGPALVDDLRAVSDALRAGASLRSAIAAVADVSALRGVADAIAAGEPAERALRSVAADPRTDPDVATACCVLAIHASAGGDPIPAVTSLQARMTALQRAGEEAKALATQSRMGARAILLLTPAFLCLVASSDPRGFIGFFAHPRLRLAIAAGAVLQIAGASWIAAIIRSASGARPSRTAPIPVLRALRAILVGRVRDRAPADVAATAELCALVSDAGISTSRALELAAPFAAGAFGDALRAAVGSGRPMADALPEAVAPLGSAEADRFAGAVRRALLDGVAFAPACRTLADDAAERERIAIAGDIRAASVRVLVPLGALVLPAFVLACLVPLFVGGIDRLAS